MLRNGYKTDNVSVLMYSQRWRRDEASGGTDPAGARGGNARAGPLLKFYVLPSAAKTPVDQYTESTSTFSSSSCSSQHWWRPVIPQTL